MPGSDALPVSEQEIELLRELTKAGVSFMLVGLGAAVVQGADAVTKDLDLWFRSTADPGLKDRAVIPALEAAIAAIRESSGR